MTRLTTLIAATAALFALPALAHDGVAVHDAYARATGPNGAIFFQIENHSDQDDRLISAQSDAAAKLEIHTHIAGTDGVMMMRPVPEGLPIPAHGSHALARGGDHIMLMGMARKLADGDSFTVTLTFEHAGEVSLDVTVDNNRQPEPMTGMSHDAMAPAH